MGAAFVWGLLLGKAPASYALQDFPVSLFQHLFWKGMWKIVLINRADGGKKNLKKSNSDQDSVQSGICLQFSFKSG